jgi:hypothetical protein
MPEVEESDFRYMAENLVAISLSKSLVWSKTMIDDFIRDIKSNLFLVPDEHAEKSDFADRIISQIPERLYPYFWKTVFYEYSLARESGVKKTLLMLAVLAIKIVKTVGENINCPQYGIESRIRDYCAVCWEIFFNKKAWGYLNKDYQDQMFRFLKDNKKEARTVLRQAMRLIDYRDDIDDKNIACYYEALGQYSITSVYQYYIDKDRLVKRIYDDKVKNFQFDDQGDFIDVLNNMDEEDINDFSSKQQQELGKYVMICCKYNGGICPRYIFYLWNVIWRYIVKFFVTYHRFYCEIIEYSTCSIRNTNPHSHWCCTVCDCKCRIWGSACLYAISNS